MRIPSILATAAGLALLSAPAMAHHSFAMFDSAKTVTWVGTVTEFKWTNPHTHITVVVPANAADKSLVGTWDIEGASPNIMSRQGWSKASFKAGDRITIVGHPMRDHSKGGSLYYAIAPNGQKLYHDVSRDGGPAGGGSY